MRRKTIIRSILLCIICLSLSLSNISCDFNKSDETTTDTTAIDNPNSYELSQYRIVRGEFASDIEISAAQNIKKALNDRYDITLTLTTDWNVESEYDAKQYEIIVGLTDYPQSVELRQDLTRLDYSIVIEGNKIIILGGSYEKTLEASAYFIENMLTKDNEKVILNSTENVLNQGSYKYEETDLSVISLNLKAAKKATDYYQAQREPLIVKFIKENNPQSFGVQECEDFWLSRLELTFDDYEVAKKIPGTKNYVFYNKNLLEIVDSGVFWLSERPDVISYGFGSSFMISCCWAIFEVKATGARYVHMNTHLDYSSEDIRNKEVVVLADRMNKFNDMGYAVIVTGDFNATKNSIVYEKMIQNMKDSRLIAPITTNIGTFNNFDYNREYTGPIDYCFINNEVDAYEYSVIDKYENSFLSDHNALLIKLCIYYR